MTFSFPMDHCVMRPLPNTKKEKGRLPIKARPVASIWIKCYPAMLVRSRTASEGSCKRSEGASLHLPSHIDGFASFMLSCTTEEDRVYTRKP